MVNNENWIKLHRKIMDDPLWNDKPFNKACAWIDLIMLANYTDGTAKDGRSVKRGECVTSVRWLADRWGWNRKKVSAFLEDLVEGHYITVKLGGAKKGAKKGAIIRLVKYGFYQDSGAIIGAKKGDNKKKYIKKQSVSATHITAPPEKKKPVSNLDRAREEWKDFEP